MAVQTLPILIFPVKLLSQPQDFSKLTEPGNAALESHQSVRVAFRASLSLTRNCLLTL